MNQILKSNNNLSEKNFIRNNKKNFKFYFIFIVSIFFMLVISFYIFFNKQQIIQKNDFSQKMIDHFEISKLYSKPDETQNTSSFLAYSENTGTFDIIGMIKIDSLNISYPILSSYSDDLLEIAPCRISGPLPNKIGNLCIAAHNYNNSTFFSKITLLKNNDKITLYDSNGNALDYYVYDIYETNYDDLSCMQSSNFREVTLITCNNLNSNKRIIVKAKERS